MILLKERIKELRLEKNLSQKDLAEKLGASQRSISSWETGARQPDFETLEKLTKFFNVTADYLLGFSDKI